MLDFLARILRNNTPVSQPDWLGQHQDYRIVAHVETQTGFRDVYTAGNERAIYETDLLGNVRNVEVVPR